ncbi:glycosyltransferase [alpha proteobacterium U9-1i]|nr:glycosyltransferase [alpha proteobacterium U9-1i]
MFDSTIINQATRAPSFPLAISRLGKIAFVGSFPPRRCGVATFTADLSTAVGGAARDVACEIVALNDRPTGHAYDDQVTVEIAQNDPADYIAAAHALNAADVDIVSLQHEFGIFGGAAGEHILRFCAELRCPIVTTLHTVLERPSADQRRVMDRLIALSAKLVVMSQKGREVLLRVFPAASSKVCVIAHGAPDRPLSDGVAAKRRLDLAGREVALTFGLLSPNKGIESVIEALPAIAAARPNVMYVVLGATHPHLVEHEGEAYRARLAGLAAELGVAKNIRFVDAFVDSDLLIEYLTAADIYVTPYLHEAQVTSGTLAYALALGKPVVSTPYWHAQEALANGVGVLVDFGASKRFGEAITRLLSDHEVRQALARRAHHASRDATWPRIGERYLELMNKVIAEPPERALETKRARALPAVTLRWLERMTDDCGILQHTRFNVPDRNHGYCVDDNARALIATVRLAMLQPANTRLADLASRYAAFVEHAWNPDRWAFRNFMGYDRRWLEDVGSQDSVGRTLWSIGETARFALDPELRGWALDLWGRAAPAAQALTSSRALAFTALGQHALLMAGHADARHELDRVARELLRRFNEGCCDTWNWFEDVLGYDNARVPEAMLRAGEALRDQGLIDAGLSALDWLRSIQTHSGGRFAPVGAESFGRTRTRPALFDQQPIEVCATVDACWAAFDVSGDRAWAEEAERAFAWFFGGNVLSMPVALPETGGSFDGLTRTGVNRNQGAESGLSYLMALCAMHARQRVSGQTLG